MRTRKEEVEAELRKYGFVKTVKIYTMPRGVIDMHDEGFARRIVLFRSEWEGLTPELIRDRYEIIPKLEHDEDLGVYQRRC